HRDDVLAADFDDRRARVRGRWCAAVAAGRGAGRESGRHGQRKESMKAMFERHDDYRPPGPAVNPAAPGVPGVVCAAGCDWAGAAAGAAVPCAGWAPEPAAADTAAKPAPSGS